MAGVISSPFAVAAGNADTLSHFFSPPPREINVLLRTFARLTESPRATLCQELNTTNFATRSVTNPHLHTACLFYKTLEDFRVVK
jgi:hypothetical protein